jgi:hypothetical protein
MADPGLRGAERNGLRRARTMLVAGSPNFASYQELTDRRLPVGLLTPE